MAFGGRGGYIIAMSRDNLVKQSDSISQKKLRDIAKLLGVNEVDLPPDESIRTITLLAPEEKE
jgi:hypothetical protein